MSRTSTGLRLRAVSVLVCTLAAMGLVGLGAPAAQAATYTCPPLGTDVCKAITPVIECVWDNRNGTMTALWGWQNPTTDTAAIAYGSHNSISPGADNQGQPTAYPPGTKRNVFVTTFTGTTSTWRLGNNSATVTAATPRCATKPVPQVGDVGALLLGLLVIVLGSLLVLASRPRRRLMSTLATVR